MIDDVHSGEVVEFDEPRGLGVVRRDDDGREFAFHCTALLDGTRTIAVGTQVEFRLVPRVGTWEATAISPRGSSSPAPPPAGG